MHNPWSEGYSEAADLRTDCFDRYIHIFELDTCEKIIHFWLGINKSLGGHLYCHLSTEGTLFLAVFAS